MEIRNYHKLRDGQDQFKSSGKLLLEKSGEIHKLNNLKDSANQIYKDEEVNIEPNSNSNRSQSQGYSSIKFEERNNEDASRKKSKAREDI